MDNTTLGNAIREPVLRNTQGTTTANVITDPDYYIQQAAPGVDDQMLKSIIAASSDVDDFYRRIAEWRQARSR